MRKTWAVLALIVLLFAEGPSFAANATLLWNPNSETDLAGYKIYYGNASRKYGPTNGGKVIDVQKTPTPATPKMTIDIPDGTWFFAVTAYDTSANESGFSNEVSRTIDATAPVPPLEFRFEVGGTLRLIPVEPK